MQSHLLRILFTFICLVSFSFSLHGQAGSRDFSFQSIGIKVYSLSERNLIGSDLVIQPDGKMLVAADMNQEPIASDFMVMRIQESGEMDSTFGQNGRFVNPSPSLNYRGYCKRVHLLPDGKVLAVGEYRERGRLGFIMMRLYPDGSGVDPFFGQNGFVDESGLEELEMRDMVVQSDGKILVLFRNMSLIRTHSLIIKRYTPDGHPDFTFGSQGRVGGAFLDATTRFIDIQDILVQPDGKILVAAADAPDSSRLSINFRIKIARLMPDGGMDSTFADKGLFDWDYTSYSDIVQKLALDDSGNIFACARRGSSFIFKLSPQGVLDTLFGNQGIASTGFSGYYEDILIQPDGKILVGGHGSQNSQTQSLLVRYHPNGQLDTSFGSGGASFLAVGPDYFKTWAIALDQSRRIVSVGERVINSAFRKDMFISRQLNDLPGVGIDDDLSANLTLRVYPNPIQSQMTLAFELPASDRLNISLIQLDGKEVQRLMVNELLQAGSHQLQFELNTELPAGMYGLKVQAGAFSTCYPVVKQ